MLAILAAALLFGQVTATVDSGDLRVNEVATLVAQLQSDSTETSSKAEEQLIELGAAVRPLLPKITNNTPERTRIQILRIIKAISSDRIANELEHRHYSIVGEMTVAEAFGKLRQQAGLRADIMAEQDSELPGGKVRFDIKEKPFWEAVDVLLEQSNLAIGPYSGDARLFALVEEQRENGPAAGHVCVDGPFRFEASRMEAVRDLRNPNDRILRLVVMVFWEPTQTPVSLRHDLSQLNIEAGNDGLELLANQAPVEMTVRESIAAVDMEFPFELPSRETLRIDRLSGVVSAVVPGKMHKFEFEGLGKGSLVQESAGVKVTVERAKTVQNLQDVRVLVQLENVAEDTQNQLSWIYNNIAYLTNSEGTRFDDVLTEVYQQDVNEIGIVYKYDAPGDVAEYTFNYETPAGFQTITANFELSNIELP